MRNIQKECAPECLVQVADGLPWTEFSGECKQEVAKRAFREQNGLCIYCERALQMPNWSDTAHIEHLKPQGDNGYPELRYSYENMVLSCNGKPFNSVDRGSYAGHQYSSCGEHKGSSYDPDLFINPVDSEDTSVMITWGNDGAMESRRGYSTRVDHMIDILNINNHYLNNARQKALGSFQKVCSENPSSRESLLDRVRDNRTEFCTFLTARIFG